MTRSLELCAGGMLLLACAGCLPIVNPQWISPRPLRFIDAGSGEPVKEAIVLPWYRTVRGIRSGDIWYGKCDDHLAHPYLHRSGRFLAAPQPLHVWFIRLGQVPHEERWVVESLSATFLDSAVVIAPGYKAESAASLKASRSSRNRTTEIVIALTPASRPTAELRRIRALLERDKWPIHIGVYEYLDEKTAAAEIDQNSIPIDFTAGERRTVLAQLDLWIEQWLSREAGTYSQPAKHE